VVKVDDLPRQTTAEPRGTISGEAFGENSPLYALVRNECGEGTVIRAIFRADPEGELQVSPPIPLQFYGLQTGRPVTYDDNDFEVTVDVEIDTEKRFKGEVKVTFNRLGEENVYAHIVYDGPPVLEVVPPSLKGKGDLVHHPSCYPSGYVSLTEKDGTTQTGLVRIVDLEKRGAAYSRVMIGSDTSLQILVVSRDPKSGIDPAQTVLLEDARRTDGEVGVLFDVSYRPELTVPAEAIGANLGTLKKTKVIDGKATVRIWTEAGKTYFEGIFENVAISSIFEGPITGRNFEKIHIYGRMVDPDERPTSLPEPPDFYKADDGRTGAP
jgi:hypothetical protein